MKNHAPLSRRDHLRRATTHAHARIDALLSEGLCDVARYGAYLRGMQRFVRESETALRHDDGVASIVDCRRHLEADLAWLGLEALPIDDTPGVAALLDLPARLGWQYVVAGSALGARFLLREARALGFDAGRGATFLAHHAGGGEWTGFLDRLEHAPLRVDDYPRMCALAGRAFEAAHAAMEAARLEETA